MKLAFDRGTLILDGSQADLEGHSLPGLRWDERIAAWRAPALAHAELCAALAARGLAVTDAVRPPGPTPAAWREVPLRGYQEAALDSWELAGRRGIVALPTGSGKTRVAIACMARSRAASLVVVPTRALLHQWLGALRSSYVGSIGIYGDGERRLEAVTVATYESAYRHAERIGNRFELLVVDEAHHFGQGLRDELLEMATAAQRLGLTATPPHDASRRALARLIGPCSYELAIGDLTGTYLAHFDLVRLDLPLSPHERRLYEQDSAIFRIARRGFLEHAPEASWADFVRHASRSRAGRDALAAWGRARRLVAFTAAKREALGRLVRRHHAQKLLVFTPDNRTAYAVSREHLIMPITSDIGRKEREDALELFRRGELGALASSRVLNEGLDVPDASVAVIVGGGLGEREHVQRIGRLLRPSPGKRALVYELVTRGSAEVRQAERRRAGLVART